MKAVCIVSALKHKLIEHYGDHLFFSQTPGRPDVVCLRDMASFIITSKWYDEKKEDIGEESERIVAAAAKLIKAQINQMKSNTDLYPTSSSLTDLAILTDWLPPLLKLLIKTLLADELKQLAIGNAIIQAA